MDKIVLLASYYRPKNSERQKEIDECLQKNINNSKIDEIHLFLDDKFIPSKFKIEKIKIIGKGYRPTYQNYIDYINSTISLSESINVVANSDIYFDETIGLLNQIEMDSTCIVLNRWDVLENGESKFCDLSGSQDVWIFKGKIKKELRDLSNIPLGKGCCDNVFLYQIFSSGYYAGCPSLDIKAYHLHISKYRTYQEYTEEKGHGPDRVLGHHMYIAPTKFQRIFRKEYYDTHHPLYLRKHRNDPGFKCTSEIVNIPWNTVENSEEDKTFDKWKKEEREVFMGLSEKKNQIALFTTYWKINNEDRKKEILTCLQKNVDNPLISKVYLLCEETTENLRHDKITMIKLGKRPTYRDFFDKINTMTPFGINIIANSDIHFDETLNLIKNIEEKECYALSRWENNILYDHSDSQDVWIFKGKIDSNVYADFEIGRLGCDNRIAYELNKAGYVISNPSKSIKASHIHNVPSQHQIKDRISEPYKHINTKEFSPFISIVTRHFYKRPEMFKLCCDSIKNQKNKDYEHIVIEDNIGIGSHKANGLFYKNKERVNGKYVFMLDDDDILVTDTFISDVKDVVEKYEPDLIFVKMLADKLIIPDKSVWMSNKLVSGHVGTSCVVVKNHLWKENINTFEENQIGDYKFISTIFEKANKVVWLDKVYSKTLKVSFGAPEPKDVDKMVSGVVVVHNTKELFKRAYESVRKFHPNMKIIIIDGSDATDPCRQYVKNLLDKNTKVVLLNTNIGHGKGLCEGLKYVETPFVLIFDSDIEMLKSPVEEMLSMVEIDTWGVGYSEPTDLGGHEWGSRKGAMNEGPMKYLHPYFCLIQMEEYKKYPPFIHHGAPAVNIMLNIYRQGLSEKILKEFKGLGHTSSSGWTWEGKPSEWVRHDTRGTRDTLIRKRKKEIEGVWDRVIDPGKQVIQNNKITVLTCTGDRPLAFSYLCKWMNNQVVKPSEWIIVDDGKIPTTIPNFPFVKYIRREPQLNDPKHTMILNFKEGLKYVTGEKVIVWEDDEYYAPDYIKDISTHLDRYEVVGIGRSKYYHLPSLTYHHHANMGHASLAQTSFRKSFLMDLNTVVDGNDFLDQRLWEIINPGEVNLKETGKSERISKNGRGYIFDDKNKSLYVGMKGLPGRTGIGAGHKGVGIKDDSKTVLRKWIVREADFAVYCNDAVKESPKPRPVVINPVPVTQTKKIVPVRQTYITRLPPPRQHLSFQRRHETLMRNKAYQISRKSV